MLSSKLFLMSLNKIFWNKFLDKTADQTKVIFRWSIFHALVSSSLFGFNAQSDEQMEVYYRLIPAIKALIFSII